MKIKMSVNVGKLIRKLQDRRRKVGDLQRAARVYYTADHSVPVHEDWPIARRPTNFTVGGSKFLETPAREMKELLGKTIYEELMKGRLMSAALLKAAKMLRVESQKRCPVDTGELRASAGERLEA